MSFGLAGIDPEQPFAEHIIHCADLAMYTAKKAGRNQIRIYSPDLAPAPGMVEEISSSTLNGKGY